jgi:hypothetical protein
MREPMLRAMAASKQRLAEHLIAGQKRGAVKTAFTDRELRHLAVAGLLVVAVARFSVIRPLWRVPGAHEPRAGASVVSGGRACLMEPRGAGDLRPVVDGGCDTDVDRARGIEGFVLSIMGEEGAEVVLLVPAQCHCEGLLPLTTTVANVVEVDGSALTLPVRAGKLAGASLALPSEAPALVPARIAEASGY